MNKEDVIFLGKTWISGKAIGGAKEVGIGSDRFNNRIILIADREWYAVQCQNRGEMERAEEILHEYIGSLTVPINTK